MPQRKILSPLNYGHIYPYIFIKEAHAPHSVFFMFVYENACLLRKRYPTYV